LRYIPDAAKHKNQMAGSTRRYGGEENFVLHNCGFILHNSYRPRAVQRERRTTEQI